MTHTLTPAPHYDLKMLRSHYDDLKQSVRISLHNRNVEDRLVMEYINHGLAYSRFAWDMFWVSTDRRMQSALYAYLKDEHIERAMKRILAELGVGAWE